MRIQSFALYMTVAAATYQRKLQEAELADGEETAFYSRKEEMEELITFESAIFAGSGLSFTVLPQVMTVVNTGQTDPGILEFLVVSDYLAGFGMQDGGYYMSYFQYPSAVLPGVYESYTCTSVFEGEVSPFHKILSYEGTELFSEGNQEGPFDQYKSSQMMPDQDMEYAGWSEFFQDEIYLNSADETGVDLRSCTAMRAISATGAPRTAAEAEAPVELQWVDNFKYQHTYKIKAGWKGWESATSTQAVQGGSVSKDWKLSIDCGDWGCQNSGAVTLGASALALVAALFAY